MGNGFYLVLLLLRPWSLPPQNQSWSSSWGSLSTTHCGHSSGWPQSRWGPAPWDTWGRRNEQEDTGFPQTKAESQTPPPHWDQVSARWSSWLRWPNYNQRQLSITYSAYMFHPNHSHPKILSGVNKRLGGVVVLAIWEKIIYASWERKHTSPTSSLAVMRFWGHIIKLSHTHS